MFLPDLKQTPLASLLAKHREAVLTILLLPCPLKAHFTREQYSKGPLLNCSMVVKFLQNVPLVKEKDNKFVYCPSSIAKFVKYCYILQPC